MTLTFLGTGPAAAIPRRGCRCSACVDARHGGKSRRTRSAAFVTDKKTAILIDAGPDIIDQIRRERIRRFDAVLLTHGHADAAGGLRDLDRWMAANNPDSTVLVMTDAMTVRRLRRKYRHLKHLELEPIRPWQTIRVGPMAILPFPVRHSMTPGFPTLGFSFGKRLAYASDVASLPSKTKKRLNGTRTLVLDGAMYLGRTMPAHLSADQAIRIANGLDVKRFVLTQIGHSYPPHEVAQRKIRRYLRKLDIKRPSRVDLAFDGMKTHD